MTTRIMRRLEFDAAHRVLGHEGKCRNLHGHRYIVEVTVEADQLDSIGRVVDFGVIKSEVGGWIDKHLDHNTILHPADPLLSHLNSNEARKPYILPATDWGVNQNPTAENIAKALYSIAGVLLRPYDVRVVHIRVWETPNSYADYTE